MSTSRFYPFITLVCALSLINQTSCGVKESSTSDLDALEEAGNSHLKSRVYLALDEVEISGKSTLSYYIIGCRKEPSNPKENTFVYDPFEGLIAKKLNQRVFLYEFNPVNKPEDGRYANGDCEVLFGGPTIEKFQFDPESPPSWFLSPACASTLAGSVGFVSNVANINGDPKIRKLNMIAGGITLSLGTIFCNRDRIKIKEYLRNKKIEENKALFARYFNFATSEARNDLMTRSDPVSREFRSLRGKLNEESTDTDSVERKMAEILLRRTVEVFNRSTTNWKKSPSNDLKSGSFNQGSNQSITGGNQFFDAIKDLSEVHRDDSDGNSLKIISNEVIEGDTQNKCLHLKVPSHSKILAKEKVPIFFDEDLSEPAGFLKVGDKLLHVQTKEIIHSSETPAIQVKIAADEGNDSIANNKGFWVHPHFVESEFNVWCDFY